MYHSYLIDDDIVAMPSVLWPDFFEGLASSSNTLVPQVVHEDSITGNHSTADTDLLNFNETTLTPVPISPMGTLTAQSNYSYPVSNQHFDR